MPINILHSFPKWMGMLFMTDTTYPWDKCIFAPILEFWIFYRTHFLNQTWIWGFNAREIWICHPIFAHNLGNTRRMPKTWEQLISDDIKYWISSWNSCAMLWRSLSTLSCLRHVIKIFPIPADQMGVLSTSETYKWNIDNRLNNLRYFRCEKSEFATHLFIAGIQWHYHYHCHWKRQLFARLRASLWGDVVVLLSASGRSLGGVDTQVAVKHRPVGGRELAVRALHAAQSKSGHRLGMADQMAQPLLMGISFEGTQRAGQTLLAGFVRAVMPLQFSSCAKRLLALPTVVASPACVVEATGALLTLSRRHASGCQVRVWGDYAARPFIDRIQWPLWGDVERSDWFSFRLYTTMGLRDFPPGRVCRSVARKKETIYPRAVSAMRFQQIVA